MRTKIIAGNWKMNKTCAEAVELVRELKKELSKHDLLFNEGPGNIPAAGSANPNDGLHKTDIIICPPAVTLCCVAPEVEGTNIKLGAQNVHFEKSGAFTGEISAEMLTSIGVEYAIIGHSERRQYFGETDETVNKRTIAALAGGLIPIVCVGEHLAEREAGVTEKVVVEQTKIAFTGISASDAEKTVIAYEPVWAIGTGKVATNEQANEVCAIIRNLIKELYGEVVAEKIRIQYGGSMNDANAADLLAMSDIDGGLIGGASLKADSFSVIVNAAN